MDQDAFDEIINFVLQTVTSEEYLQYLGIPRYNVVQNVPAFKKHIKSPNMEKLPVGIYPLPYPNASSVHYFAVRQESNGRKLVGNGYPYDKDSDLGPNAVCLDAQPNRSHGLCQTFALMFYLNQENRLIKGNGNIREYYKNVRIGLQFLLDFINGDPGNRDWEWTGKSFKDSMEKMSDRDSEYKRDLEEAIKLMRETPRGKIKLSRMIQLILLGPMYENNLKIWFVPYEVLAELSNEGWLYLTAAQKRGIRREGYEVHDSMDVD